MNTKTTFKLIITTNEFGFEKLFAKLENVINKIKPYKKILDKQLWNDLTQYFLVLNQPIYLIILSPRVNLALKPTINLTQESTVNLIQEPTINHLTVPVNLTKELPVNLTQEPSRFELILQGSKDGFAPGTFWNIWDTFFVCKVEGTDEILGGYNPLAWNKTQDYCSKTSKSFIFKDDNIQNPILKIQDEINFTQDKENQCWIIMKNKLSQDLSELLNDKEEYNVAIEVDQEPNKKTFTAHSTILRYRSSHFNKELSNAIVTNDYNNNIKTITKPNISAQIFEIILKYIYGGIIDTENIDTKTMFELMIATNEFGFEELSAKLESYLIEIKSSWLRTHFSFVYHSIFKKNNNNFKDLEKFCNDIITKYPNLIFESAEFTSLQETALLSILKRDDLQMKESEIWDYIIKWGIARNPILPEKLEEWSKEDFKTLKTTLQQCLPHIRYFHISNLDFINKIKPYKKILDKQLWNDLTQYLLVPDQPIKSIILPSRVNLTQELSTKVNSTQEPTVNLTQEPTGNKTQESTVNKIQEITVNETQEPTVNLTQEPTVNLTKKPTINLTKVLPINLTQEPPARVLPQQVNEPFSTIINQEHAAIISSWIDYQTTNYSSTNNPYEFQLIFRGSKDGFAPGTFWDICDGYYNTIVVCKVKGTDEILGGYNPLAWNKTKEFYYMKTNKSFIFSFKDDNIQNPILSRVKNENHALKYYKNKDVYGPCFGLNGFKMKSKVSNFTQDKENQCWISNNYYEKSIRANDKFSIIDYEVLQVRKI
ncbi:hypothetical protein Glove_243g46 [Diversispora epigaea]|uniref:BTB domain-containing protein n=1 Tax=Diversispora epigaea TaxID=1348612 RepID=A0A397IHT2_9GLOM|nr:hypothetical protein Glove_243g46 [Diversispora epigaea]